MARIRRGGIGWSEVRVGVVILVALAVLALAIFNIGKLLNLFAKRYELVTLLPSAAGLPRGAQVTLAGQRIGQVDAIDFIPVGQKRAGKNIRLRLGIAREVADQIRTNSHATLLSQGLLGDRYVDITPGSPRAAPLHPGDTIPFVPSPGLDEILVNANQAIDTAMIVIDNVQTITHRVLRGEGTLGRVVNDETLYVQASAATIELRRTLVELNDPSGTFGRLAHDPALYNRLLRAVGRVDSLAAAVTAGQGTLGRLIYDDSLYSQLLGVVGRADTAVTGLSGLLGQAANRDGTFQRLLTDPQLYDQFLKAVIDLQTLVKDIRQNPKRFRPEVNVDVF
ncbi:MAG TPA: MlaD family protein [Longimicrobiales bacterium]|nr:MlaD family protein [Longimicrobiales bacterium]